MTPPIGLQLYTLRELIHTDFPGTIKKFAQIGFIAVEVASIPASVSPEQAGKIIRETGLQVVSAHAPLPLAGSEK